MGHFFTSDNLEMNEVQDHRLPNSHGPPVQQPYLEEVRDKHQLELLILNVLRGPKASLTPAPWKAKQQLDRVQQN